MLKFKIVKKSKKSRARLGILETKNGVIETPCFVPVATQATVKTLDTKEVKETKSQILICNTFHLHLKPGEDVVQKAGGLHKFMNWPAPLMTDSGGFQVFSLGFGMDLGTGKIINVKVKQEQASEIQKNQQPKFKNEISVGQSPKFLKITDSGVHFRSFIDGRKIFLGPRESIRIQEKLGADIIFAFDECTSPLADYEYTKNSLLKTHKWAKVCLDSKKTDQALFGIVQGGKYKDLRIESARFIGGLDFEGFGIGGEFGSDKQEMMKMLNWTIQELPEEKPKHLLGIGYLEDMAKVIKSGVDLFDCAVPTHYARRGVAFTSSGKINFMKSMFLRDKNPIDKKCSCFTCQNYRRDYICHLLRAKEITALKLLTFHNLHFFNTFVENLRNQIKKGKM